jgi:hypothetical protein
VREVALAWSMTALLDRCVSTPRSVQILRSVPFSPIATRPVYHMAFIF